MIGQLDLKFITHYGEFILQDVAGKAKPLGTSVNLLHRLSKNQVSGATGWHGYALFTEASLHRMDVHPLNVHAQTETYEHLGTVETFSMNLDDRYGEFTSDRHAILAEEEAHIVLRREFPVPPSELWEWLNDPEKRLLWMVGSDWHALARPQGRTSKGASNHCANSDFIEHILDWRPFSYYTVELMKGPIRTTVTAALEPTALGTRVSWRARLNGFLPRWILRLLCKLLIKKGARTPESFDVLTRILQEEKSVNGAAA